jgi:hypothetical protein
VKDNALPWFAAAKEFHGVLNESDKKNQQTAFDAIKIIF